MLNGIEIAGIGAYTPEKILTNHDLEKMVDTSDEWITSRTGIKERHIAAEDQPTSALAALAAEKALNSANISPEKLDIIIVATITPDEPFPNTACHVQRRIGAENAFCFELEAACSGFLYMFEVASALIKTGNYNNALIIGAEKMSAIMNWKDRDTCVLFGDGAGAVVLKKTSLEKDCFIASSLRSDGQYTHLLHTPGGGSLIPTSHETVDQQLQYLTMSGKGIFKLAVNEMTSSCKKVLEKAEITIDQVKWLIPHQANVRIIKSVGRSLKIPTERVYINVDKYGNTSSATIPICMDEIKQNNLANTGDYILMTAFGGGLTFGATLIKW
ncbi:MAG: beta-ketoacyl-ACP synthase III [Verrucomicrobiota bacterium]|nr:beta-ketoacyl-ACP synthase III [Verrucomicrobiota bacterium]